MIGCGSFEDRDKFLGGGWLKGNGGNRKKMEDGLKEDD